MIPKLNQELDMCPISGGDIGEFMAMSTSGEILWKHRQRAAFNTAALTTAGGLVFLGDWNRYINAYDVKTGDRLWQTGAATSAQGFPISTRCAAGSTLLCRSASAPRVGGPTSRSNSRPRTSSQWDRLPILSKRLSVAVQLEPTPNPGGQAPIAIRRERSQGALRRTHRTVEVPICRQ